MSRRRIIIIVIGCSLLPAILFLWRNHEPHYNGRSLSAWVRAYDNDSTEESETAIRHIGSNAIPLLLQWVDYEPSDTKQEWLDRINQPIEWLHDKLGATNDWTIQDNAEKRAAAAEASFDLLAAHANHAVPQLASFLNDATHPYRADTAAGCLARLGQGGLPPLQAVMEGTNDELRAIAFRNVFLIETNVARLIVPLLIKTLGDTDSRCVIAATRTLGSLGLQPEAVVPAMVRNLSATSDDIVWATLIGLKSYRESAQSAIPAITNLLNARALHIRRTATNVLHAIDPQTFTNDFPRGRLLH